MSHSNVGTFSFMIMVYSFIAFMCCTCQAVNRQNDRMKYLFLLIVLFMSKKNNAQQTRFEKSNGKETATYHEIIAFYKQLDNSSDIVALKKMGSTDAGYPLHLMMVSSD